MSRTFVERTRSALGELMRRRLDDVRLAVMMIDGLELQGRMMVVALGITTEGVKIPLGLWEGSTENATVATALLSDLVERGLDPEQGILFVIDGAKALRKAIRNVFGEAPGAALPAAQGAKRACEHLPERDRPPVKARLRRAWRETDYHARARAAPRLAGELDRTHPGAAGSLREGMEETLTLTRLGVNGKLKRTLETTNPCESMIEIVRRTQRNVKRWSSGEMALRWTAAGMLEAEKQFRKVIGYRDLATLVVAIERRLHLPQPNPTTTQEAAASQSLCNDHTGTAVTEIPRRPGHPRRTTSRKHEASARRFRLPSNRAARNASSGVAHGSAPAARARSSASRLAATRTVNPTVLYTRPQCDRRPRRDRVTGAPAWDAEFPPPTSVTLSAGIKSAPRSTQYADQTSRHTSPKRSAAGKLVAGCPPDDENDAESDRSGRQPEGRCLSRFGRPRKAEVSVLRVAQLGPTGTGQRPDRCDVRERC